MDGLRLNLGSTSLLQVLSASMQKIPIPILGGVQGHPLLQLQENEGYVLGARRLQGSGEIGFSRNQKWMKWFYSSPHRLNGDIRDIYQIKQVNIDIKQAYQAHDEETRGFRYKEIKTYEESLQNILCVSITGKSWTRLNGQF
jgi:hypothetical protein